MYGFRTKQIQHDSWPPYTNDGECLGFSPIPHPNFYDFMGKLALGLYANRPILIGGKENLPSVEEKTVITPTHAGFGDIVATSKAYESLGRLNFLSAEKEVMAKPGIGFLFNKLGVIPIKKGFLDAQTYKQASQRLYYETDSKLVIYPEGILREGNTIGKVGLGAAILATMNGAVVSPYGISGPEYRPKMVGFTNIFGYIGEKIIVPKIDMSQYTNTERFSFSSEDKQTIRQTTEQIRESLQTALDKSREIEAEFFGLLR